MNTLITKKVEQVIDLMNEKLCSKADDQTYTNIKKCIEENSSLSIRVHGLMQMLGLIEHDRKQGFQVELPVNIEHEIYEVLKEVLSLPESGDSAIDRIKYNALVCTQIAWYLECPGREILKDMLSNYLASNPEPHMAEEAKEILDNMN